MCETISQITVLERKPVTEFAIFVRSDCENLTLSGKSQAQSNCPLEFPTPSPLCANVD